MNSKRKDQGNYGDGAVLLFVQMAGRESEAIPEMPDESFPYLIPDDSDATPLKSLPKGLEVSTRIARADVLDLSNEVPLDGHVTIEVKYL
ncbi:hypothetical protein [Pseudomonas sp. 10S4]|uniref:hypothetical protein n=1 Tax=Pseudomonas sp. 10S4 TaxID=3048583 RepID=UPI002AC97AF0|nr:MULTISPECIES: hypothetical protein [unclassified Pseudomonas]MEB0223803.1 hypothetical protein [Pseudomonas sp. 5S1]MEB0292819.1 hypothetical protein [Pseudomonas sp. 10S4]WPX16273.1 hypothetical protein RHM58_19700 [Pseudomonas sp. 10S4]